MLGNGGIEIYIRMGWEIWQVTQLRMIGGLGDEFMIPCHLLLLSLWTYVTHTQMDIHRTRTKDVHILHSLTSTILIIIVHA
jgi:hypothetical protein